MKRWVMSALLLAVCLAVGAPAFALSDADYKKMMRDPEFAQADRALNAAASVLEARLMQLDRLSPGDTLSYLETQVEQGGEKCWEFSAQAEGLNAIVETGRYAVSPSGKVYEFEGDKYVPMKK